MIVLTSIRPSISKNSFGYKKVHPRIRCTCILNFNSTPLPKSRQLLRYALLMFPTPQRTRRSKHREASRKKRTTTKNTTAVFHFDEKNFSFESASLVTLSSNRVARHATKKQVSLPLAGTQTWTPKRSQGLQASSRQLLKVAVKRSRDSRTRQHTRNVMPHTAVARNTSRRIWTQAQKVATNDKYIRLCTTVKLK